MEDIRSSVERLHRGVLEGRLGRRDVLKRAMALGLSAPVIATLLAACGSDDEEDTGDEPSATTSANDGAAGDAADATSTEDSGSSEDSGEATEESGLAGPWRAG